MTSFIDSHAHLADPAFEEDVDEVITRARLAGAEGIVCIGESLSTADRARQLAGQHPGMVWWTAGVHPHDAADFDEERDRPLLLEMLGDGAVAVGECGLDYHYDNSPRPAQRRAFGAQLAIAAESRRPVVVHTRDAEHDTRVMLSDAAGAGVVGVLHCYTGSAALADSAIAEGWYVSFSGIVTFRTWKDDGILRLVPDERLLVESDSPYLAPVPWRGRRNEPAWVAHTVERLAAARGIEAGELGATLIRNARRLFGLASAADG